MWKSSKILKEYEDDFLIGQTLTTEKSEFAKLYHNDGEYTYTDHIGVKKHVDGPPVVYKINKDGFRSNSFSNFDPNKESILFAGCSISFGEGLPEHLMWSSIVADKHNIDNFFNVSTGGGSIRLIVKNIITFIKKVGRPNTIYVVFPNFARDLQYDDVSGKIVSCVLHHSWIGAPKEYKTNTDYTINYKNEYGIFTAIENIRYLEYICKILDINLIWSSWSQEANNIFEQLDFIYYFKGSHLFNFDGRGIKFFPSNNTNGLPYWTVAQDGVHPGSGWNELAANELYGENNIRGIK